MVYVVGSNCRGTKSPAAVSFTHSLPIISHSDTSDNDMLTFVISDVDSGALKLPVLLPVRAITMRLNTNCSSGSKLSLSSSTDTMKSLEVSPGVKVNVTGSNLKSLGSAVGRGRDGRRRGGEGTGGGEGGRDGRRRGGDGT